MTPAPANPLELGGLASRLPISVPEAFPLLIAQLPPEGLSLLDLERDVIIKALELNGHNQSRTARYLHIPRHVLLYRAEKYGIPLKARNSLPEL